ncbi:MAG TPA: TolC family protein, partial [Phycisphaerae bacterium]|nr:TolC family protein [Phycisphaerae bacterium]
MSFQRVLLCAVIVSAAMSGGCLVGPDYKKPAEKIPDQFHVVTSQPSAADLALWWKSLNDPVLDDLVDHALAQNLDLAIAVDRVEEARAARVIVAAGLWPMLGLNSHFPDYRRASANVESPRWDSRPRGSLQLRQNVDKNGVA